MRFLNALCVRLCVGIAWERSEYMKKAYLSVFAEIDYLEDEDILTTSPDDGVFGDQTDEEGWT